MKTKSSPGILHFCSLAAFFLIIPCQAATITWTNTSGGNWSLAANWNPNQVPGSSDDAVIAADGTYLVTLDTSPTINSLTLGAASGEQTLTNASFSLTLNNASMIGTNGIFGVSGGSFGGSGNLGVQGLFNWTGGQLNPGSSLTIASNGVLNIEGGVQIYSPLTNAGTVNWQAGDVALAYIDGNPNYAGAIWNQAGALWAIQCDQQIYNGLAGDSAQPAQFQNAGTVSKSAGSGTTSFNVFFANSGSVQAQNGTIDFNDGSDLGGSFQAGASGAIYFAGGTVSLSTTPEFQGPGLVRITGASVLLNDFTGVVNLYGASVSGQIAQGGTLNLYGGNLYNGSPGASLTVASNAVLNVEGTVTLYGPLTNAGTVNWQAGDVDIAYIGGNPDYAGAIWNEAGALWAIQCDQQIYNGLAGDSAQPAQFQNAGTVSKSAGSGTTSFNVFFANSGSVQAQNGTIDFNDGSDLGGSFQAGASGAIYFAGGTVSLSTTPEFQGPGLVRITGASVLLNDFTGVVNLYGASVTGQIAQGGTLNLYGGNLYNGSPGASLTVASNGVLNIEGTLTLYGPLTNAGTVNWQAGDVDIAYIGGNPDYAGAIWNEAGALWAIQCDQQIYNSYAGDSAQPAQFQNAGTVSKSAGSGTTSFNVFFANSGSVQAQNGTIDFNDGSDLGGSFQAGASGAIYFAGGTVSLSTTPEFQGPGLVRITGASVLLNDFTGVVNLYGASVTGQIAQGGTLNLYGGNLYNGSPGASLTVASNGVLNIEGTLTLYGALTNEGTVNWQAGDVDIRYISGIPDYAGAIWNEAGALWTIQCDQQIYNDSGTSAQFQNAGTVSKSAGSGTTSFNVYLNNSGILDAEAGTISLNADFALTGGTLNFGISNLTSFGQIYLSDNPSTLDGSISVHLNNSYLPAVGDSFSVLTFASASGAFTNFSSPSGAIWKTNYTPTALVLTNIGQITWATPANITYGTPLGASQLNPSTTPSVAGTFAYNPVAGTVLNSGAGQLLTATFTPSDPSDAPASFQVPITVLQAPLSVTATNQTKTYGQTLSFAGTEFATSGLVNGDTVTSASLASTGAISNAPVSGSPYAITINNALGDAGLTNYIITYANGQLTVNPAPLGITANSFSKTYGSNVTFAGTEFVSTPLQNSETMGTVTLTSDGAISNAPVSGSPYSIVPSAATGGTFTPGNYAITYTNGALTVNRAGLTVTANPASRDYGAANPDFSAAYSGFVNGETISVVSGAPDFSTAATVTSGVGTYSVTPSSGTLAAANYTFGPFVNGALTINPSPLTIASGITVNNKVYDRTTMATLNSNNVALSTVFNGDTVSLNTNGYVANFAIAGVGNSIAVTVSGLTLAGARATNYTLTQPAGLTANITAAAVTISSGITANSKVYDRTTTATLSSNSVVLLGIVSGDTLSLNTNAYTATFASAEVGNGIAVTVSGLTLAGASNADYTLTQPAGLTASITAAAVTISSGITANNKVYDRTTSATLSSNSVVLSGIVSGDTLALNTNGYAANFASAGVGNSIAVTVSGLTLAGASNADYTLTQPAGLTANITAAAVTISSGITANSKVYDRTTTATLSSNSVVLLGIVSGDTLTLNTNGYAANFASAGVGNSIAVTVSGLTLTGASNADYTLTQPAGLTANITAATVTISSGITANNKVYDRTTSATLSSNSVVLSGIVSGDTLALNTNGYAANFASAGVGNSIAVTVSGLTLAGASNADYTLTQPAGLTANITAAAVTISSGITANSKVYDRTTTATLGSNSVVLLGIVSGDTLSLNTNAYTATFASAEVGNGIAVTVSGLTLAGASNADYTLTQPAGLTASITAATVTISSGITANSKVYDRTTSATLSSNSVVLSGIVSGDTLALNTNGYAANFASAGVGNSIAVTVSGLTLAGASNADYTLTQPAGLTANITAATVTISSGITANSKVYDRTTSATLSSNSVVLSGIVSGDTLALNTNGYAANFASAGVGNSIAVTVSGLTLAGASNADYTLTQPAGLAANITAATVTISSGITANSKVYDRTTAATLASNSVVLSGIVSGDTLTLNTNGYAANFASAGVGSGIAVTVTGLTLAGASNADYTLTQPATLGANITAATVTISSGITANNKVYDRTTSATLSSNSVVLSGIVSGDTLTLNTNGYAANFASAEVGNGIAVTVSGLTLTGASNADYTLTQPATLAANITAATVTISSGITANNKVYDRTTAATLSSNSVVLSGIVSGDTLALDTNGYAANFASAGVGNSIAVTVSGLTLAGASNADYTLTQPAGLTASITAATVTISSGITANNKVYDRTTTATLSSNSVLLSGIVSGDTLTLDTNGYVANFAGAGVGSGIAVTVSGLTLAGASNADYTLTQPAGLAANITAATVTISSGITANSKVYDRTTAATLASNSVVLSGIVSGDTLTLDTNGYVANFASAGVGSGIAVTVSGLTLAGASNADYTLTQPAGLAANITAPSLTIVTSLTNVIVSWPANASAFVLNKTASLTLPITWTQVTTGISIVGTNNTITNNAGAGNQYYSLIAP